MKQKFFRLLILAIAAVALWFFTRPDAGSAGTGEDESARESETSSSSSSPGSGSKPGQEALSGATGEDATKRLMETMAALKQGQLEPDEARRILKELRDYLGSMPPEVAAAVLADFLKNPTLDSATGLPFAIGANGFLDDPSSLRVALLDWLAQFDLKLAGEVAASVLSSPTQADEWAVSLRNYARANPTSGSFEFLRGKAEELIRNSDWQEDPSVGYFEAFDVLVYTKATESSELLGELVSNKTPEGRSFAHASYLTLDRLVIKEPVKMMKELVEQPGLTKARGKMVGNMFARADLRDEEQRQLVRQYLLDPSRTHDELSAFAGVYPNNNYSISKNLLTGNDSRTNEQLVAHDQAALKIVESWLEDPEFEPVKPHVGTMHRRLVTFVKQADN